MYVCSKRRYRKSLASLFCVCSRSHLESNCPPRLGPARRPTCRHMAHPTASSPRDSPRGRPSPSPRLARSVSVRRHPRAPNTDAEGGMPSPLSAGGSPLRRHDTPPELGETTHSPVAHKHSTLKCYASSFTIHHQILRIKTKKSFTIHYSLCHIENKCKMQRPVS